MMHSTDRNADSDHNPTLNQPAYVRVFVVEMKCLACGREAGLIASNWWPTFSRVLFQATGAHSVQAVPDWSQLGCAICCGYLYADAITSKRVYAPLSRDDLDVPRRGRPPKWLVVQRQAAHEDADAGDS
jgi:hypothetical protein